MLALAVKHECLIVEDDPYGELWFDTPPPPPLFALRDEVQGAAAASVYLSSLSKTLAPGLRLGWMLGPPEVRRACVLAKQTDDMHTSTLTQQAAALYLSQGHFDQRLPVLRANYCAKARALTAALREHLGDRIQIDEPGGGLFVWARMEGVDTAELLQKAIAHGVMFVPGSAFFAGEVDRGALRLSFAEQGKNVYGTA